LPRAATRQLRTAATPEGQDDKRPFTALLVLEAGWLLRRTSALQLAASRLAVSTKIAVQEYPRADG